MRCYACNCILTGNTSEDKPTGRSYCEECFSWTVEVQLALAGKEYFDFTVEPIELEGAEHQYGLLGLSEEEVPLENPKDTDDEDF